MGILARRAIKDTVNIKGSQYGVHHCIKRTSGFSATILRAARHQVTGFNESIIRSHGSVSTLLLGSGIVLPGKGQFGYCREYE